MSKTLQKTKRMQKSIVLNASVIGCFAVRIYLQPRIEDENSAVTTQVYFFYHKMDQFAFGQRKMERTSKVVNSYSRMKPPHMKLAPVAHDDDIVEVLVDVCT